MASKRGARMRRKTVRSTVVVNADERWHMIEDAAYFRADRFRPAAPGSLRESDRRAAAAALDKIIGTSRRRRKI